MKPKKQRMQRMTLESFAVGALVVAIVYGGLIFVAARILSYLID